MNRLLALILPLILPAMTVANRPAAAAWPHEPNNGNVAVCTAAGDQGATAIVSDGAGGAIVTWTDGRSGTNSDIYAQRINSAGAPQWTANGVALCLAPFNQVTPKIVSDGAGGAIVTWNDARGTNQDIYAQRINASGIPQWTANGVALCTAAGNQLDPGITSDGAGGAIVIWSDERNGLNTHDIYAQRISAAGVPQWAANGAVLCAAPDRQQFPTITSDGAGGAIATWNDVRNIFGDIYAQRISAAGVPQWAANGVALCTAAGDQGGPTITADGAGGAIVTWGDFRAGNYDVYAQRVSAGGSPQWTANGVALCTASDYQVSSGLVSDGAGGAIVTWIDYRTGNYDIYARRISAAGAPQWTANGVALCTASANQNFPTIVTDGAGGAIVTWSDERNGPSTNEIYAQHVSAAGVPQWAGNGAALCTAISSQNSPTITSDGAGGAIVSWDDFRAGNWDVYAQRIARFGKLGSPEPAIASVLDIPNDQGGRVRLAWDASYLDLENDPDLTAYDIFHSVPPNFAQNAIAQGESRELRLGESPSERDGQYLFTVLGTQQLAWEYVSTVNPQHFIATYGSTQATTGDSTATSNPGTSFMVVARNAGGTKYWLSAPAAGYSVDDLAPNAPAAFTGQYAAGTTNLHWNRNLESDLAGYRLYRGASTSFVPGPGNLVAALPDTGYADAAGAPYVYKLTAIDSHGNESPVATVVPGGTVGADDAPPVALSFAPPSPNPARFATALNFTLSRAGHLRLAVYDVSGRRVKVMRDGELPAGMQHESFELRDEAGRGLASGLYLVRLEAEGRVLTRRLAVIR